MSPGYESSAQSDGTPLQQPLASGNWVPTPAYSNPDAATPATPLPQSLHTQPQLASFSPGQSVQSRLVLQELDIRNDLLPKTVRKNIVAMHHKVSPLVNIGKAALPQLAGPSIRDEDWARVLLQNPDQGAVDRCNLSMPAPSSSPSGLYPKVENPCLWGPLQAITQAPLLPATTSNALPNAMDAATGLTSSHPDMLHGPHGGPAEVSESQQQCVGHGTSFLGSRGHLGPQPRSLQRLTALAEAPLPISPPGHSPQHGFAGGSNQELVSKESLPPKSSSIKAMALSHTTNGLGRDPVVTSQPTANQGPGASMGLQNVQPSSHEGPGQVSGTIPAGQRPDNRTSAHGSSATQPSSRASKSGSTDLRPASRHSGNGTMGLEPGPFHAPAGSTLDGFSPLSSSMVFAQGFSQGLAHEAPKSRAEPEPSDVSGYGAWPPPASEDSRAQQQSTGLAAGIAAAGGLGKPGHHRRTSSISKYSPLQMSIMHPAATHQPASGGDSQTQAAQSVPVLTTAGGSTGDALVGDNHSASQKKPKASYQQQQPSSIQGPGPSHSKPQLGASEQQMPASAGSVRGAHRPQPSFTYSPLMAQAPAESLSFNPGSLAPVLEATESILSQSREASPGSAAASVSSSAGQTASPRPASSHHATQSSIFAPLGKARHDRTPSWTNAALTEVSEAALDGHSASTASIKNASGSALSQKSDPPVSAAPPSSIAVMPQVMSASGQQAAGTGSSTAATSASADSAAQLPSKAQFSPEPQRVIRHSHAPSSVYAPLGKAVRSSRILAEDSPRRQFDAAILGSLEDPFPRRQTSALTVPTMTPANASQGVHQPQPLQSQASSSLARGPHQLSSHAAQDMPEASTKVDAEGPQAGYPGDHAAARRAQEGAVAVMALAQLQSSPGQREHTVGAGGAGLDLSGVPGTQSQQVGSERWWAGSVMSDAMLSPLAQGAVQLSASQSLPQGRGLAHFNVQWYLGTRLVINLMQLPDGMAC